MSDTASGGGRDVIFRIKTVVDPKDLQTLKQYGDEAVKVQKRIVDQAQKTNQQIAKQQDDERRKEARERAKFEKLAVDEHVRSEAKKRSEAAKAAQRERERELREQLKHDKRVADNHVREHLNALKAVEQARRKALRDAEREAKQSAQAQARAIQEARMARIGSAEGLSKAGMGALNLGRGLAYSGLIGEEDTQKLLNNLIAIEASFETLRGGIEVWKGLTQWATNYGKAARAAAIVNAGSGVASAAGGAGGAGAGAAGAGTVAVGGVAMTAAAALAAVAGAAAAVVSAFQTIGDIGRHGLGGGADYGSWRSGVGTFVANRSADVVRATKGSGLEWLPAWQALNTVSGGMVESEGLIKQQQERHARRLELEGQASGALSAYGGAKTYRNLDSARAAVNEFRGYESSAGSAMQRRAAAEQVVKAETETLRLLKEQGNAALSAAKERVSLAERELSLVKDQAREAKSAAEAARQSYMSDITRFALMSDEEQAEIRRIDAKRDRGENLTREELQLASGFKEFESSFKSSIDVLAEKAGAGDVFTNVLYEKDRLAKEAAEIADKAAKAEVTLKGTQEVVVRLEASEGLEGALKEEFDKLSKDIADRQLALELKMEEEFKKRINALQQNRKQNIR